MKTYSYQNLTEFGINPLTGEACAYGKRILCDLDQNGVELVAEFLGVYPNAFPENWNSYVGKNKAVASVMLHRNSFTDIIAFALMLKGWRFIIIHNYEKSITATDDEHEVQLWRDSNLEGLRIVFNPAAMQPHIGSRNIHQMSGRTI